MEVKAEVRQQEEVNATDSFFQDTVLIPAQGSSSNPQKDVKNDIMSLFEKVLAILFLIWIDLKIMRVLIYLWSFPTVVKYGVTVRNPSAADVSAGPTAAGSSGGSCSGSKQACCRGSYDFGNGHTTTAATTDLGNRGISCPNGQS